MAQSISKWVLEILHIFHQNQETLFSPNVEVS